MLPTASSIHASNLAARGGADLARSLPPEAFEPVDIDAETAEIITRPQESFWGDVWRRFKQNRLAILGLIILVLLTIMAIIGPALTPYTFQEQDYTSINQPPSSEYWFGTDALGRDIFTRVWIGGRISLFIAIAATLLDLVIGVAYGGISGYFGGMVDEVMMRFVDILYGIPYLLLVILLLVVFQPGLTSIILAMGLTGWIGMARLVRGQILQLKEQEFVLAARQLGASSGRIIYRHLLPNTLGVILVNLTLSVPGAIFGEAFLSFIGLGLQPPMASWGTMVNDGYKVLSMYPWQLLFAGLGISMTMFAFNVIGDGLRDALDPRLKD